MTPIKINPNLLQLLYDRLDPKELQTLLNMYQQQSEIYKVTDLYVKDKSHINETLVKPKRLISHSKQRSLLKRSQSKNTLTETTKKNKIQVTIKSEQQGMQQSKRVLRDKAVFINVSQLPYLHSSDLLNHLYKKGSNITQKTQTIAPLYNPPLSNIHALTKVKHLHIYYCKVESLRDIGTGWGNLIQLTVYFGKLKDLSGLNAFPALQYLHCPFNAISTLSDLMFHPTIISLDLQFNQVSDYSQVEHLFTVDNLEYINLMNNPVYQNKQSRRKINEKFDKIIESQNTRLEDYVSDQKRQAWQIQNMEGVEYCNNLLNQFYQTRQKDQITLETKYQLIYHNQNILTNDRLENLNDVMGSSQAQGKQQECKQLKIQYIGPQIPQNAFFEQMIINGQLMSKIHEAFCQEKIFMTPLTQIIDTNSFNIGPVLAKYLNNKLFFKEEKPKNKNTQNQQNQPKINNQLSTIKLVSKLPLDSSKSKQINPALKEYQSKSNIQGSSSLIQTPSQLGKTSTSLSTNCTNLNNTSTSFAFKRTRPNLSKSNQKSLTKNSLISKLTQNIAQTQFIKTNLLSSTQSKNDSLVKQSRMLLNRNMAKESIVDDLSTNKNHSRGNELSMDKQCFSSALRRRAKLSDNKKQRSLIMKKAFQP